MKTADIMTLGAATVRADASIGEAARIMLQHGISGLPVLDAGGQLVGIVTEGDFLRRTETGTERRRPRWLEWLVGPGRQADEYVHSHGRRVADVMSRDVVVVAEDTPVEEAVRLMERHRVKRLPVVRDGKVVGILGRANLMRMLAHVIDAIPATVPSDRKIREQILAELAGRSWAPRSTVSVMVRNGMVELSGAILDERERQALRVAAENVPGVKGVIDRLVWIEPMSGMAFDAPSPKAGPGEMSTSESTRG
jgi:CBS domain-containing protein